MAPIANPTTVPHALFTFGGTMGTGADAEIWQCGIKLGSTDSGSTIPYQIPDLTAYLNAVKTPFQTWWTTAANLTRSDFKLTFAKVANIAGGPLGAKQVGGTYAGAADSNGGPNPAQVTFASIAGSTSSTLPHFLALAITFRASYVPKSLAGHQGRIYAPLAVGNTGSRANSASVTAAVTSGLALLSALKTGARDTAGNVRPVLCGRNGTIHFIDQVSVGDVIDVQRRRKNKLHETYTTSAFSVA